MVPTDGSSTSTSTGTKPERGFPVLAGYHGIHGRDGLHGLPGPAGLQTMQTILNLGMNYGNVIPDQA